MVNVIKKGKTCKGLFFRGYSSIFYNHKEDKVERREGFRLLKNKSCKGCPDMCFHFMLEEMHDMIDCKGLIFPEIVDNGLYTLRITNITKDWESGQTDGYDFEFYKIKE